MNISALNLTENYSKFYKNQTPLSNDQIQFLRTKTFVFIPGILSESAIADSKQRVNLSGIIGDYFSDYFKFLDDKGIKYHRIIVESEAAVEKNSKYIEQRLNKIPGKLIVITHSKGGLEFLDVLIRNHTLRERIDNWISLQSPYRGSAFADELLGSSIINTFITWTFEFLGGDVSGLASVGRKHRTKYLTKKKSEMEQVLKEQKFLQFVTYIDDQEGIESAVELSRDHIQEIEGKNDGMVSVNSSLFKEYNYILLSGVDHLTTVLDQNSLDFMKSDAKSWSFNRKAHFQALLKIILEE